MEMMMSISWVGVMILIGMLCRAKIKPLGNILLPASVIGGLIGFGLMNANMLPQASSGMLTQAVGFLFTISFISIGLTGAPEGEGGAGAVAKQIFKGSMGMGFIWDMMYVITPLMGFFIILLVGKSFDMNPLYGLMIPFAFCQGPGQSAVFGGMIEANGWPDAVQVGVTYAAIGFLFAFGIGVPMAKWGLKRGLAKYSEKISDHITSGLFPKSSQEEHYGRITTYSGSIDVLAFHMGLVGLCFIGTIYMGKLLQLIIPGTVGDTFASMTFLNGMIVAYIVRFIMGKLNLLQYHDSALQTRITGWSTDFLICAAFMSIQVAIIGKWIVPMLIMCLIVGIFTLIIAVILGQRLGGDCDFERTLGLWGCLTGTCPTGIALIRIVDPNLRTTAPTEMGAMNVFMIPTYIFVPTIIGYTANPSMSTFNTILIVAGISFAIYFGCMIVFRLTGRKTFNLLKGQSYIKHNTSLTSSDSNNPNVLVD